jgi:cupin 2 domain-containing protein
MIAPANLLSDLPAALDGEVFTALLAGPGLRLERIVSHGQSTPSDSPMVQDRDEWVLVIAGGAGLRIGNAPEMALGPGDYALIPAGTSHWVTWTREDTPTVWLALHFG